MSKKNKVGMTCPNCKQKDKTIVVARVGWYRCKKCGHVFHWG